MERGEDGGRGARDPAWEAERAEALRTERNPAARLIWAAWERDLDRVEKDRVRRFVATRMFDPYGEMPVPEELWYEEVEGMYYTPDSREPSLTIHRVKHGVLQEQWPEGTTDEDFHFDVQTVVLDDGNRLFVSRFRDGVTGELRPQLGIIGETTEDMRGPEGRSELLVEFRLDTKHVATAFQLDNAAARIDRQEREGKRRDLRWLR